MYDLYNLLSVTRPPSTIGPLKKLGLGLEA